MHPFLDVSKLTDDEIMARIGKAYVYMNSQKQLGHSPTVHSIQEIIQALEDERGSRMMKQTDDEFNRKYADANKPIELGKLED